MATVLVSEAEKVYVLHGVQEDLRCDGRGRKDVRPIVVETDIGITIYIYYTCQLDSYNLRIIRVLIVFSLFLPNMILSVSCNDIFSYLVTHASGSAHLRLANTDILVGVKGKIGI